MGYICCFYSALIVSTANSREASRMHRRRAKKLQDRVSREGNDAEAATTAVHQKVHSLSSRRPGYGPLNILRPV